MIWPLRRRHALPEAPLWDHLDACQIPYQTPLRDWAAQFHLTATVWSDGLDDCIPHPQTPLFAGLDTPLRAQVDERADFDACPDYLWGAVRNAGSLQLNYARAIAGLTKRFGKGQETSASNTVARTWRFGHARLHCTVWPPDRQHAGRNDRHRLFPETIEEALITVSPAWRPPLGADAHAACADATGFWVQPPPGISPQFDRFTHDWPRDVAKPVEGIALAGDTMLVTRSGGLVDIIPRAQIYGLSLTRLTQARGAAGSTLYVQLTTNARAGAITTQRVIARLPGTESGLDGVAEPLAARLDSPLDVQTAPSD